MKVTLTESGGFANIKRKGTVDTVSLPADLAARLEEALCHGDLFDEHVAPSAARDARQFVIEVDCDGRHRMTTFSEAATPPEARPVIEILRPYCTIVPNRVG